MAPRRAKADVAFKNGSAPNTTAIDSAATMAVPSKHTLDTSAKTSTEKGASSASPSSVPDAKKVGLLGLVALVISAMVGGGVYNLPQSMSSSASAGGQIIAWGITGIGMWFIANTFRVLSCVKPQMKNGIYTYAEKGFGKFIGFLVAYGYWICNCIALVAYGVMIMATLGFFFPALFADGTNIPSLIGGSVITWLMFALACRGVKSGAAINVVGTIGKIIPVLIFIVALITAFQLAVFLDGFWGYAQSGVPLNFDFSDVMRQVSGTMMITLFLFTGIEGAVVVSGEAKSQKDVSKATTIGFLVVLLLYAAVSILPLGVYSSPTIASMHDPSMAVIMNDRFGALGAIIVNIGVLIAVLSSWLVWMLMLAQMPLYAAHDGLFPKKFSKVNKVGAPGYSLFWSTVIIQLGLIASHFMSGNAWDTVVDISAVMCMPCYMACALFLWKVALREPWRKGEHGIRFSRTGGLITGALGTAFTLYMLYSSGLAYLMPAVALYAVGIPFYIFARRQAGTKEGVLALFTPVERGLCIALFIVGIIGVVFAALSGMFS